MNISLLVGFLMATGLVAQGTNAFTTTTTTHLFSGTKKTVSCATSLNAIGALAKKTKAADLRKYVEGGIDDSVREKYGILKKALEDDSFNIKETTPGPLQQELTKRKGTITVVAEYRRKNDALEGGFISDVFVPELLSPSFRENGASAVAVVADERMGGCTYDDLAQFIEEQRRAKNNVPGPLGVINSDLIIDELQIARSAAMGAAACVITLEVVGEEQLEVLLKAAKAVDVESIVAVTSKEEAQKAVDIGARMILVNCLGEAEEKAEIVKELKISEGQQVCTLANILTRKNNQYQEIEDAWALRDKGFNSVWVGDALYKAGNEASETPAAVLKSMKSKSSLKWASAKARSGKGEGAREYLGDIMM